MFSRKEGVDDLCMISSLSNDEITGHLKARLAREQIYTSIGDVLVSVNPFKRLPIYGPDHIQIYATATSYDNAPHIYALAQTAYSDMMGENQAQSVIISGESGAGKTECAKLILNFISAVSGASQSAQRVKAAIEASNPVLESFGNAKTVRNDNSSRFGKYLEINFSETGEPISGSTLKFLLERARIAFQAKGERNFHIFYQFVKGASQAMIEGFGLSSVSDYYYLSQSGTNTVSGVDDSVDFQEVLSAMNTIGISELDQWRCFQVLAAILHIGNIQLDGDPKARVINKDELKWGAYLLGIEEDRLELMLTVRLMGSPRGSIYESPQNGIQAAAMRDALAKTLYNRVFNWLIEQINNSMKQVGGGSSGGATRSPQGGGPQGGARPPPGGGARPPPARGGPPPAKSAGAGSRSPKGGPMERIAQGAPSGMSQGPQARSIGVLDIYGFEIMAVNSYEQFCINYVNERLQQIFIDLTLKREQREYHEEDMKWNDVKYFDNLVVVELIEGKNPPGIFRILDDICRSMHAVDSENADGKFIDKMSKTLMSADHLVVQNNTQFLIKHYAGDVVYTTYDWTSKNKDNLFLSIVNGMQTTNEPWIMDLFKNDDISGKSGPPTTSGADIRQSAQLLIERLGVCAGHYIRCIKSNDTRSALSFDYDRCKHQVTYLGLLENVKIKKSGYSYRHYFRNFIDRFGPLVNQPIQQTMTPQQQQKIRQGYVQLEGKDGVQTIIRAVCNMKPLIPEQPGISSNEFAMGRTKIFVKSPETIFQMNELLEQIVDPVGYKLKMEQFKQVERIANKNKRKELKGLKSNCSIM